MNRRELIRNVTVLAPAVLVGCATPKPGSTPVVDVIIGGLQTADEVAQAIVPIIQPVNAPLALVVGKVDGDIQTVVKVYEQYDTAAGATPSNADLLRATAAAIQANLSEILADVGVKNPELLTYVRVGVAVINTAILAVLTRLPAPAPGTVTTAHAAKAMALPTVTGDLKAQWNQAVAKAYPGSVVR